MLTSTFAKTLRDQRRGLIGWGLSIAAIVVLMAALWPTVRDMSDLTTLVENYPEPLRDLFNFDQIGTPAGYLNAELYSIILPAMFLVFAISRGARVIAGEEEDGTLEAILATPLPRRRLLAHKAFTLAAALSALGVVLAVSSALASAATEMDIATADHLAAAVSMVLLGGFHGGFALAVGAATGQRSVAVVWAGVLGAAGYILRIAGGFSSDVEPWRALSPFHALLSEGALGSGLGWPHLALLLLTVATVGTASPIFDRRDVGVA